jgi:peptidoglycan/xylan/chitin deacetylase (PgdA/CDA1 family)
MTPFSLTVMMYHYVHDPGDEAEAGSGIPGLPVTHFETQLDELARRHEMIGWPDLHAGLSGEKPPPPSACLLTFDDGLRDHYLNVFPALRSRGLSGLFFALARGPGDGMALGHKIHFLLARLGVERLREAVWLRLTPEAQAAYARAEERYRANGYAGGEALEVGVLKSVLQRELSPEAQSLLSQLFEEHIGPEAEIAREFYLRRDQITEMAANGMSFGGHSRSHPWLDWVDASCQADEISASAAWLREVEAGPWAFAYPYGGHSAESPGLLRAHGFAAAFTTVEQVNHAHPFFIGRWDGELFARTTL